MRKKPVSLTLSDFELDCLTALATNQDRSLSYIVGVLIRNEIREELPDTYQKLLKKHDMVSASELVNEIAGPAE